MKIAPFAASALVVLAACSSSSSSSDGDQDRGLEGTGVASADSAPDKNPDGVPYPKDNIGTSARTVATAGNRIANYKFLGYPDGNKDAGLQPISLANYFDPTGQKYAIIHIQAAGVWCSVCQAETETVVPMKDQLAAKKAVWLVSIAEGPTQGKAATQSDMDGWIKRFASNYTHWLDPGNAKLGPFYDASALPWNANIDARTMEILTAGTGGYTAPEGILKEIDDALKLAAKSTLVGQPQ